MNWNRKRLKSSSASKAYGKTGLARPSHSGMTRSGIGRSDFCWTKGPNCAPRFQTTDPCLERSRVASRSQRKLALGSDPTGARWLSLLAAFEGEGCHGSWRRPVLMALPRSENASELFECVEIALVADRGRRLKEIIQLMLAVETTPLSQILARVQSAVPISDTVAARMVMPSGSTWMPFVVWLVLLGDRLPSAVIPDAAKLFQLWLLAAQGQRQAAEINQLAVQRLYEWLTRIEEAKRPIFVRDARDVPQNDLDFERMNEVHEEIRMTFLSFCHLNPNSPRGISRRRTPTVIMTRGKFCNIRVRRRRQHPRH